MNILKRLNQRTLIFVVIALISVFGNFSFFKNVIAVYGFSSTNFHHFISLFLIIFSFTSFITILLSSKYTTKPLLIIILIFSSFAAYFMDVYGVMIDDGMIINTLRTDVNESLDLFSLKLCFYVFFLGILPAILVFKAKINYGSFKREFWGKIKTLVILFLAIILLFFASSKFYTSFLRENKPLRFYTNPTYWIYSVGKVAVESGKNSSSKLKKIGKDAQINRSQNEKKRLVIMIVGEAARADRFSLNGYVRKTNPNLEKEKRIINFSNMSSCGTSTAQSVPCMFSDLDRSNYDRSEAMSSENALDVLFKTGKVAVLWRDNNSDSKGVALRVDFENFKDPKNNSVCDGECRDEGMLVGLDEYVKNHSDKNILIVLHQMGNHGPAYYKRYPREFEKFTPICKTNQLEKCSAQEIGNAYDNAILYTDYFLSKTINFLKNYSEDYQTAMFYVSDHGESLGENGLYLHGLPYFMAPEEQTHIASVIWIGSLDEDINFDKIKSRAGNELSHDNVFHTLLGMFEVESKVYNRKKDILKSQ